MINILGISGSSRIASFNTALLQTAGELLIKDFKLEIFIPGNLPLYNDDLAQGNTPDNVERFRQKILSADGLLIASPEYNYSFSGLLKNAMDWAGTDTLRNLLSEKPVAIMGASKSIFGTARGQMHLRQVLAAANADVILKPEVYVPQAQLLIDDTGRYSDQKTQERVHKLVRALIKYLYKINNIYSDFTKCLPFS